MAKAINKAERVSFAFSRYETTLREKRDQVSKYVSFAECKTPQEAEIFFQLHPEMLSVQKGAYVSPRLPEAHEECDHDDKSTDAVH